MRVLCFVLLIFVVACKMSDPAPVVEETFKLQVHPNKTDVNYSSTDKNHYVVRNSKKSKNKLLLFIGGSYSNPADYYLVSDHAATLGLDVINLSYLNDIAAAPLGSSADRLIFDNYREELCFGTAVSNVVSIDALNCIATRAINLVIYLNQTYPDQNWGQYLTSANTLQWSKIILTGHSQGAGHACYLAKQNLVDRVVMFSGPNDYHGYFSAAANWLSQPGKTPVSKQYVLLHTQDEIVPFNNQIANISALGLLAAGQSATLADNLTTPYSNSRALSISITALSNHSSTIGGNAILPGLWTYLFTE
jgi:hypothetical protein